MRNGHGMSDERIPLIDLPFFNKYRFLIYALLIPVQFLTSPVPQYAECDPGLKNSPPFITGYFILPSNYDGYFKIPLQKIIFCLQKIM